MPLEEIALRGKCEERPTTALARFRREGAPGLYRRHDDEILEKAARLDVGFQLEVGPRVGALPDVARRRDELKERNGPDHDCLRTMSRRGPFSAPAARPNSRSLPSAQTPLDLSHHLADAAGLHASQRFGASSAPRVSACADVQIGPPCKHRQKR